MNRLKPILLLCVIPIAFTACQPAANTAVTAPANTTAANSNTNAAKTTATAPTKEALMSLEKSAFEAWKSKDAKFWETFLASNFIGYSATGKLDRAAAIKEYTGSGCEVSSYSFSDEQMTPLGADAALVTHKTTYDGTCGGHKLPGNVWTASIYTRDGDKWKGLFHGESPMPDPNAKPAPPTANKATTPTANGPGATPSSSASEAKPDAATDAMLTAEKKAWDDWKTKNSKGLEDWSSPNMVSFTNNGRQDRASAIKTWMEDGCQVNSTTITQPSSISIGPDYSLFLFRASVDGKCKGQPVGSENGATVYAKENGAWKALFTMGTPIP